MVALEYLFPSLANHTFVMGRTLIRRAWDVTADTAIRLRICWRVLFNSSVWYRMAMDVNGDQLDRKLVEAPRHLTTLVLVRNVQKSSNHVLSERAT